MGAPPSAKPPQDRLDSWKEIAGYLNRDVTTVQRWEKLEGMPVHRHLHDKTGSVYAFRADLDDWVRTRNVRATAENGFRHVPLDAAAPAPLPISKGKTLRAVPTPLDHGASAKARTMTRLIVLPFRMLRADSEYDFLAFSLPDAITISLSGLTSLVVRSSATSARYGGDSPDLRKIATEAEVDVVLTGTILRGGDQLRVATQLSEAPGGALICSQTAQFGLKDIFQLQDELVRSVVESLALPLSGRETQSLKHDIPASPLAYEYYLRANQWSVALRQWATARELYLQCVELDPQYAPAWARLGRSHHLMAKWGGGEEDYQRAEAAYRRAFDLNPKLTLAHHLYAFLDADLGRAPQAMVRLLERARNNRNDPNLFAGLVHVCRYCGLLEASIAAHQHARRLDPLIVTSVAQSFFLAGDYQKCLDNSGSDESLQAVTLPMLGRNEAAIDLSRKNEKRSESALTGKLDQHQFVHWLWVALRALFEGKRQESLAALAALANVDRSHGGNYRNGEEQYARARFMVHLGEGGEALIALERSVEAGFLCYPTMTRDPWLDPLRADSRFAAIVITGRTRHDEARRMFIEAGGNDIFVNCLR